VKKLLNLVEEQAVEVALIEYPDRLVRFGLSYLEQAFRWKGVCERVKTALQECEQGETTEGREGTGHSHHQAAS
jgi:predicted site-specific integrase-resolvase